MDPQLTDRTVLRPTDELDALPSCSSVSELLGNGLKRGRYELLPPIWQPASAWYPEAVASPAGNTVPSWWEDDPLIGGNPVDLFRLRDAYFVPAFGVVFSAEGEVMSQSMAQAQSATPDLALLPHTERTGDETVMTLPHQVEELDRVIVSMPWGARSNYGHFVLDCLSTVASVVDLPELNGYRFAFPPLEPWQRRHLELLGVEDPLELEIVDYFGPIFRVSDVIWGSCMGSFMHQPNITYRVVRDKQFARKEPTALSFDKVYITRRGFISTSEGAPKRIFLQEEALEERLRGLGFAIFDPAQHTIDEQIDIFRHADVVVGCSGAAFANVIYCHEGAAVVEITPMRMTAEALARNLWVRNICAVVGCKWRPYYCADNPPEKPVLYRGVEQPEIGFSFDVDIEDLVGYIEALSAL
jgi:capsular polysaccharide biosynthesis protein